MDVAGFWPQLASNLVLCRHSLLNGVRSLGLDMCVSSVAQSCSTLCDPMDCNLPGVFIHGILQAKILELVAIPFSGGPSWPRDQTWISCFAGRFFTIWATREALNLIILMFNITPYKVLCYVLSSFSRVQLFLTLRTIAHQLFCPWDSPGKDTGVGCHAFLQGISVSSVR